MARFGYLYLRQGKWADKQVVPSEWVTESTTAYSETPEGGYGYLWWVDGFDLPVKSFSARGALAKYIVVIPERDLVVVYQNHTEMPDKSLTEEEIKQLPTIPYSQMGVFLKMILDAQRGQPEMVEKQ
jgi:CubicO group peptidase (beta-lactamase class C family)